jgi:hypothetical protein
MPLTREQLEKTDWAKRFKADSPVSYAKGIALALQSDLEVGLHFNEEAEDWQWCVVTDGFWMDAFPTRNQALTLCKEMGWKIAFETNDQTSESIDYNKHTLYTFKDGQAVKFDNEVLVGTGIVRGVSTTDQAIIGAHYMIEVKECNVTLPNETYPFSFIPMFECHLKAC